MWQPDIWVRMKLAWTSRSCSVLVQTFPIWAPMFDLALMQLVWKSLFGALVSILHMYPHSLLKWGASWSYELRFPTTFGMCTICALYVRGWISEHARNMPFEHVASIFQRMPFMVNSYWKWMNMVQFCSWLTHEKNGDLFHFAKCLSEGHISDISISRQLFLQPVPREGERFEPWGKNGRWLDKPYGDQTETPNDKLSLSVGFGVEKPLLD